MTTSTTISATILAAATLLTHPLHAQQKAREVKFHAIPLIQTEAKTHILTPLTVEGKAHNFIVDSGFAGEFLLNKPLALELGKKLTPIGKAKTVAGKAKIFGTKLDSLHIGKAIKLKNHPVQVSPLPAHLNFKTADGTQNAIGGLIGSSFFVKSRAIISYRSSRILIPPRSVPKNGYQKSRIVAKDHILPFTLGPKRRPFLELTIKGKKYHFLVDSAAGGNIIDSTIAKELKLKTTKTTTKIVGGGDGQASNVHRTIIENINFAGKIILPKFDFLVLPNHSATKSPEGTTYGGIIGSKFLRLLKAEIDYGSNSICIPRRKK